VIESDFFGELFKLIGVEGLGCDVDKVPLGGVAVVPVEGVGRGVGEAFELAEGLGEHFGVVGFVDDPVAPFVLFEEGRSEVIIAEAAAAFPFSDFGDAAFIFAVDDFLKARDDVSRRVRS